MIAAFDVDYQDQGSFAAGIVFCHWEDDAPTKEYLVRLERNAAYIPGQFYRRELPCILAVMERIDRKINFIVIDGFVTLGRERKPGLGKHLSRILNDKIPIIGVAKAAFTDTPRSSEIY